MRISKCIGMIILMGMACWAFAAGKSSGKSSSKGSTNSHARSGKSSSNSASSENRDSVMKDSDEENDEDDAAKQGESATEDQKAEDDGDSDSDDNDDAEESDSPSKGQSKAQSHSSKDKGPKSEVVQAMDGDTLTVTGHNGRKRTVHISEDAVIQDLKTCKASDLESGETIRIWGVANQDGTFSAEQVIAGAEKPQKLGPKGSGLDAVAGTIESTDPLRIKDDEGNVVEVSLSESAKIERPEDIALEDIQTGDRLVIGAGSNANSVIRVPRDDDPEQSQAGAAK